MKNRKEACLMKKTVKEPGRKELHAEEVGPALEVLWSDEGATTVPEKGPRKTALETGS